MNGLTMLSETSVQALGWMLLHFVWQGIAVAAVLAGTRIVIKNPGLRYATACAALLAMVVLPVSTLLTQDIETPSGPAQSGLYWSEIPHVVEPPPSATVLAPESVHRPIAEFEIPDRWAGLTMNLRDNIPQIVLWWLVGVLLLSLRLLGGCWYTYRLKHTGTSPLPDAW